MKGNVAQTRLRPLALPVTDQEPGRGRGQTARAVEADPRPDPRTGISGRRVLRVQRPIVPVHRPETGIAIGTAAIIRADPLARHERERQG
jgi:hypothetical protein